MRFSLENSASFVNTQTNQDKIFENRFFNEVCSFGVKIGILVQG